MKSTRLYYILLMLTLSVSSSLLYAAPQPEEEASVATTQQNLSKLKYLFKKMHTVDTDGWKSVLSDSCQVILYDELIKEKSFKTSFRGIKYLTFKQSRDRQVRVFSWRVPYSDGKSGYVCFIQTADGGFKYFDKAEKPLIPNEIEEYHNRWYGCEYTDVVPFKIKEDGEKHTVYVLIGYAKYDKEFQYHVVDVVDIDEDGNVDFGYPIFKIDRKEFKNRLVYKYDVRSKKMRVRYSSKKKTIALGHLEEGSEVSEEGEKINVPIKRRYDFVKQSGKVWTIKMNAKKK
ncbi:hypothetical protein N9251_02135 [Gammaproteobacteria bacterium]|nr:hypothetical protein [Gammaproteobacteria bacterium]